MKSTRILVIAIIGALLCIAVIAPPRAWEYHYVLLALPLAYVLHRAIADAGWRLRLLAGAAALLISLPRDAYLAVNWLVPELLVPLGRSRVFGALALWLACLLLAWRGEPPLAPEVQSA